MPPVDLFDQLSLALRSPSLDFWFLHHGDALRSCGDYTMCSYSLGHYNTPEWLVESLRREFTDRGYSVAIDNPYSGCLVPDQFTGNPSVPAAMVEINRRLYLNSVEIDKLQEGLLPGRAAGFDKLRYDICSIMLHITSELRCKCPRVAI